MSGGFGVKIIREDEVVIGEHEDDLGSAGSELMGDEGFFDFPEEVGFG